jgi:hypothetical protein
MSNLQLLVRNAIKNFVESQDGHHLPSDVLRIIAEEALLKKETQDVCDMLDQDPMEQLNEVRPQVERLKKLIDVTSCSRVRTGSDYCLIHAIVTIEKCQNLQLTFKYERQRRAEGGCHVWYSIQLSRNSGQPENLLVVQVWAPENVPCTTETAVCIHEALEGGDDDQDGWEDIDEDGEARKGGPGDKAKVTPPRSAPKKRKTTTSPIEETSSGSPDVVDKEQKCDTFMVFLDPEVLENFLEWSGLLPMNEGTAFFLLMTFPYCEHEWDLVGYALDQVFGDGEEDESEGEE